MNEMKAYSFGSDEFMAAIYRAKNELKEGYPLNLNTTDFTVLVRILKSLALYDGVSHKDIETIPGYGESGESEPIGDWAMNMLSSIAESLGVEGI
jgi:hypothetical protein